MIGLRRKESRDALLPLQVCHGVSGLGFSLLHNSAARPIGFAQCFINNDSALFRWLFLHKMVVAGMRMSRSALGFANTPEYPPSSSKTFLIG
jgi:hypothetical protein